MLQEIILAMLGKIYICENKFTEINLTIKTALMMKAPTKFKPPPTNNQKPKPPKYIGHFGSNQIN
jgi:hypothetical protein